MKKIKFMLVALLALFGYNNAIAQQLQGPTSGNASTVVDNYYKYTLTSDPEAVAGANNTYKATVELTELLANPVQADYSIYMPADGVYEFTYGAETYQLTLTTINATNLPLKNLSTAKSITIPKTITSIPASCFDGCSDMTTIAFQTGSQVTNIGTHAFATTKIVDFDFSPCTKLTGLNDEVFVEAPAGGVAKKNSYIKKVTLPTGGLFKHINGAFRNLTKLGEGEGNGIINLENSWIQEVIADAFSGCESLTKLSLPGKNLQYIDQLALQGSSIEELSIDVTSLVSLGGLTVDPVTYQPGERVEAATNLYGDNAAGAAAATTTAAENIQTPLKTLTLTGVLTGIISGQAFAWCDLLNETLDLTGMTLGSTGQLATGAFKECYYLIAEGNARGIKTVKIGDITDNQSNNYAIAAGVFEDCDLLETVEIGDINTTKAIGAAAFGDQLKSVTIGTIKADGMAIQGGAFVWAEDVKGASLTLACGTDDFLNANTVQDGPTSESRIIGVNAFDMHLIEGVTTGANAWADTDWPVIKIGQIKSLGGVFAQGAIKVPAKIGVLTFMSSIAANGLDVAILDAAETYAGLTKITFEGTIGRGGIATGAFANISCIKSLIFNDKLLEGAVKTGAFAFPIPTSEADLTNAETSAKFAGCSVEYNYVYTDRDDYTVNPFENGALNGRAVVRDVRYVIFKVAEENEELIANYEDETSGLTTGRIFDIFLAKFAAEPDPEAGTSFVVYRNNDSKTIAWGRYDLGAFFYEPGPAGVTHFVPGETQDASDVEVPGYAPSNMIIDRYQTIDGKKVKLTLYGTYIDENADAEETLVYMVPLQVFNGKYNIEQDNNKVIIIKAENQEGEFANEQEPIKYTNPADLTGDAQTAANTQFNIGSSIWTSLPSFATDRSFYKNYNPNGDPVDVVTTQILWDRTNPTRYDVWGGSDDELAVFNKRNDATAGIVYAPKAIYSISNPANNKGIDVIKLLISKNSGKIGQNWYWAIKRHFGDITQAARVIWLDDAEATAIFGVKEVKTATGKNSNVMYNLQGMRIVAPAKGQLYIMNGKKYIAK